MTVAQRGPAGRSRSARLRSGRGEQGSTTVVGLGAVLAVLAVFAVALQLGAAMITRHRAEAAADLAALAAASHAVSGAVDACATARRVTDRMAAGMVSCELRGWEVDVRVEAAPPGLLARFGTARATARAGPAVGYGAAEMPYAMSGRWAALSVGGAMRS